MFTSQIDDFVLPLPPVMEQEELARKIGKMLVERENVATLVDSLAQQIKSVDQAILAKASRGELAPQDPNDEPASVLLERIQEEKARKAAEQGAGLKKTGRKTKQPRPTS